MYIYKQLFTPPEKFHLWMGGRRTVNPKETDFRFPIGNTDSFENMHHEFVSCNQYFLRNLYNEGAEVLLERFDDS